MIESIEGIVFWLIVIVGLLVSLSVLMVSTISAIMKSFRFGMDFIYYLSNRKEFREWKKKSMD